MTATTSLTRPLTGSPAARIQGNFVLLRADTLRLLLPQQDVGAAEYVEHAPRPTAQTGVYEHGEGEGLRRVVALSGRMRPLAGFPEDRFVFAGLRDDRHQLAFAWNEIQVLIDADFEFHELPEAMRVPDAPIQGYVERDGEVVLCTTAERVLAYAAS